MTQVVEVAEELDLKGLDIMQSAVPEVLENVELVPSHGQDIMVFARTPDEMARAQDALINWAERKLGALQSELKIKEDNLTAAKEAKIRTAGWQREVRLVKKDINYYTKVHGALKEGYFLVPDFPVSIIGVRTNKTEPTDQGERNWQRGIDAEPHGELPIGAGEYKDPTVPVYSFEKETGEKDKHDKPVTKMMWTAQGNELRSVDFPMRLIRPHLLKDLQKAMGHKIFDAIGVLPAPKVRNPDPMVVGVIESRQTKHKSKRLLFLISWWIPTESL